MSVEFTLFEPSDLRHIRVRECFEPDLAFLLGAHEAAFRTVMNEYAWTGWSSYGQAIACCGILETGEAWAFVDPEMASSEVLPVHRKVKAVLKQHLLDKGPVAATVNNKLDVAARWAYSLGFKKVGMGTLWVYR